LTKTQGVSVISDNIGSLEKPYWVYRLSITEILAKIATDKEDIFSELVSARLAAETDELEGNLSSIRHGSIYKNSKLLQSHLTRDLAVAFIGHSDEIDTCANVLGSHSGRSVLAGSLAVANAKAIRWTNSKYFLTFLVAGKETTKNCTRGQIFAKSFQEFNKCQEGICMLYIYIYIYITIDIYTNMHMYRTRCTN